MILVSNQQPRFYLRRNIPTTLVPETLGLNRWEFEVWTLWCRSPSASTHRPSAGETHQPDRERQRKEEEKKISLRAATAFRENLRGFDKHTPVIE